MTKNYQAVRFHVYGGSEKLVLETVPFPTLAADEILIEVYFAGVNPIDWKIRSGYMKDFMPVRLPFTPGIDVSGVVVDIGPAVKDIRKGQAVFGIGNGTYAQYVVAKEGDVVPKPDNLSFEMAATVPVGALTAWKAVADAGAQKGLTVVIQGAAGGVGLFAVQFAALKGSKVVGIASEDNLTFIRTLGAERSVAYNTSLSEEEIRNADIVIDLVGGDALEKAYSLIKRGATLVTIAGQISDEKAKSQGIKAMVSGRGPTALLKEIAELLANGSIHTQAGRVFPLEEAKEAQDQSQAGHGRGHLLLKVKNRVPGNLATGKNPESISKDNAVSACIKPFDSESARSADKDDPCSDEGS
jgi:NADPH:quinone reductase-like Zn-dependent oxidoreductase